MGQRTQVHAEDGKQELTITRVFDLPLELLFRAYTEPALVAQWMGMQVLKLESHKHGSYQFETIEPNGNPHRFSGVIHDCVLNERIIRTFEIEDTPFPVQLEFLEFERLTDHSSKLRIQIIYKSVADRDQILRFPFKRGINLAHNRLQEIAAQTQ
jgi:uncharacterized protein YndB with AHSA1/START domain